MVSIVIINYNTFEITCNCIQSIIQYSSNVEYEIILVDNASTESNPDDFLLRFPNIKLIKNLENSGFAKGNNLGIKHSTGDVILLLNSDTYLIENTIDKSLTQFKSLSKIGFLGVKMVFPDGRIQHTARKFRSVSWELFDLFRFILFFLPYQIRSKMMLGKYFNGDFDIECDWINGAFLMFNRSILDELPGGKLDERFFMYGEDHLWSYQFKKLGYRNYFYSGTSIVHINNASTSNEKRFALLKVMYNNELEIIEERYGVGMYFYLLVFIYGFKEKTRMILKKYFFKL
jgi:GT2 family glycosyltransferase